MGIRVGRRVFGPAVGVSLFLTAVLSGLVAVQALGAIEMVSVTAGGTPSNGASFGPVVSSNGRYVAFLNSGSNLVPGDTNGYPDVFVRDRATSTIERVNVDSAGNEANGDTLFYYCISADGRFVSFISAASNLVPDDTNRRTDLFVRDRLNGTTERVSVNTAGDQGNAGIFGSFARHSMSADGRYLAFCTDSTNLVPDDTNGVLDVFVHDRLTGITERVSVDSAGVEANQGSYNPSLSADGRYVAFDSTASNLVPNDTNGTHDVFLFDRDTRITTRISVNSAGEEADKGSNIPCLSGNARLVLFASNATNLSGADVGRQCYVRDLQMGTTRRVSITAGTELNSYPLDPRISRDGRFVTYYTLDPNLVSGDTNVAADVFVYSVATGQTACVSYTGGHTGDKTSNTPDLSDDGTWIVFDSAATNLVAGDTNMRTDSFIVRNPLLPEDNLAPACEPAGSGTTPGGADYQNLLVQDPESGLASITPLLEENCTVTGHTGFPLGTHDPLTLKVTRTSPSARAQLQLRIVDCDGNSADYEFWINRAPVAADAEATTPEDASVALSLAATDQEGDGLTFSVLSGPQHGQLTGSGVSRTYTPALNYHGPDQLTFRVSDGLAESATATIALTVSPVNDAPTAADSAVMTDEDTAVSVPLTASDVDGDSLTYEIVSEPEHGTLSGSGANRTYTPAGDFAGSDSFTFRVSDGSAHSSAATVSLSIRPVNDAPRPVVDSYTVDEDSMLTQPGVGVLANDTDPEGSTLSAVLVTGPSHGVLSLESSGAFVYTPDANFHGADGFTYASSDGTLQSAATAVALTVTSVNDAPVAVPQSATTDEDTSKSITLAASDVDGDALTFAVVNGPQHGMLSGSGTTRTYLPSGNYAGPDSFTFRASDGLANSATVAVTITVLPVNDVPVAANQSVTIQEDTARDLQLIARDAEGDALTYSVLSGPAHGTLGGTLPNLTYTPALNYTGPDSFTFRTKDALAFSGTATISITVTPVNDAPTALADAFTVNEDATLTVATPGVLANDTDIEGTALSAVRIAGPAHGSLTFSTAGGFTYVPAADYHGSDQFTYQASDGALQSSAVTVTLTIASVPDAPIAIPQSITTPEDTPKALQLSGTDADGDSLTFQILALPQHGSLSGTLPRVTYTPTTDYQGSDEFSFRVDDGTSSSAPAKVSITVAPVGDPPVGTPDAYTTSEDATLDVPAAMSVLANDTDPDGDALTATLQSEPAHGVLTFQNTGAFSYHPEVDFHGSDQFTYRVGDGVGTSNPITVLITVAPVNDPPAAAAQSVTAVEDTALSIQLTATDADGDTLAYAVVTPPNHGTLTGTAPKLTYLPASNYSGLDSFSFRASDGDAGSEATVSISVTAVNDPPVAMTDNYSTFRGTSLDVPPAGVLANDTDAEGSVLHAAVVSAPGSGTLTLATDGSFRYVPKIGFTGVDQFTYRADDGAGGESVATVNVTVSADPPATTSGSVSGSGGLASAPTTTFKVQASRDRRGRLKGSMQVRIKTTRTVVKSTSLTALVINGGRARVFGKAQVNGGAEVDFVVDLEDQGEPSRGRDRFGLEIGQGSSLPISLIGKGKIRIKP